MRIKSFSYESDNWSLQKIDLQTVNLIVGKNGVGKSKTLFNLFRLIEIISSGALFSSDKTSHWEIEFKVDNNYIYNYKLMLFMADNYPNFEVKKEKLCRGEDILYERNDRENSIIFSEINNGYEYFNPPKDNLILNSRRDFKSYPYIESIIDWSKFSFYFDFSEINSENQTVRISDGSKGIIYLLSQLNEIERNSIILNFNLLGFNIESINLINDRNYHTLFIKEVGISEEYYFEDLSQGMLRALCLLIYIEYLISKEKTATLLIDDLGEGLDYHRATELGKLLFKLCKENNIQLIATSNDSFLMDVIDIDCWNVLKRDGKTVSAINITNNPKLFEDFRYTGLSNFDFFSSDYIPSHL